MLRLLAIVILLRRLKHRACEGRRTRRHWLILNFCAIGMIIRCDRLTIKFLRPCQKIRRMNRIWLLSVLMGMKFIEHSLRSIDMGLEGAGDGAVGYCGLFGVYLGR